MSALIRPINGWAQYTLAVIRPQALASKKVSHAGMLCGGSEMRSTVISVFM
jgi:hypothetical protein